MDKRTIIAVLAVTLGGCAMSVTTPEAEQRLPAGGARASADVRLAQAGQELEDKPAPVALPSAEDQAPVPEPATEPAPEPDGVVEFRPAIPGVEYVACPGVYIDEAVHAVAVESECVRAGLWQEYDIVWVSGDSETDVVDWEFTDAQAIASLDR